MKNETSVHPACEPVSEQFIPLSAPVIVGIFFHRILISRFRYVENSLHFNFTDFPVNFIKQFVSCFFLCLKLMSLSKFVMYYCLDYIIPRISHIISRKSWYSMQAKSCWWAIPKICMYLISRFYSNHENLMLAKYTCFTAVATFASGDAVFHTSRQSKWRGCRTERSWSAGSYTDRCRQPGRPPQYVSVVHNTHVMKLLCQLINFCTGLPE